MRKSLGIALAALLVLAAISTASAQGPGGACIAIFPIPMSCGGPGGTSVTPIQPTATSSAQQQTPQPAPTGTVPPPNGPGIPNTGPGGVQTPFPTAVPGSGVGSPTPTATSGVAQPPPGSGGGTGSSQAPTSTARPAVTATATAGPVATPSFTAPTPTPGTILAIQWNGSPASPLLVAPGAKAVWLFAEGLWRWYIPGFGGTFSFVGRGQTVFAVY